MNSAARTIKFNYALRLVHTQMKFYVTILQLTPYHMGELVHEAGKATAI